MEGPLQIKCNFTRIFQAGNCSFNSIYCYSLCFLSFFLLLDSVKFDDPYLATEMSAEIQHGKE